MNNKTKTLRVRVKDKHAPVLVKMARSVNFVWNYINELSYRNVNEHRRYLSAFDIQRYTNGSSKELGLHSQTIQVIAKEYVTRRKQHRKSKIKWRKSGGSRRSLGWVPINTGVAKFKNGQVFFAGHYFKVWDSYGLSQYKFRTANFSEDARGRWYFNVVVTYDAPQSEGTNGIGIDLGCKVAATTSDCDVLDSGQYRELEPKIAAAQRANKKHLVRSFHAKVRNQRKDAMHKFSRKLVNENAAIFVGNVSSSKLAKTKMAKSVYDASWYELKRMLEYKCDHAGIHFEEINEAYTTVTCSACKNRTGPSGLEGLRIREWTCECGVTHDRDVNAARNILALGHERLAGGIQIQKMSIGENNG